MHIIRVESSLPDGSYTLVPDGEGEIQQVEAVNALIFEDLSDPANLQQEGKHRA